MDSWWVVHLLSLFMSLWCHMINQPVLPSVTKKESCYIIITVCAAELISSNLESSLMPWVLVLVTVVRLGSSRVANLTFYNSGTATSIWRDHRHNHPTPSYHFYSSYCQHDYYLHNIRCNNPDTCSQLITHYTRLDQGVKVNPTLLSTDVFERAQSMKCVCVCLTRGVIT